MSKKKKKNPNKELSLEEKIHYQSTLFENLTDAIISMDLDYNIITWNKGAERIYGWETKDVIGKNLDDVIPIEFLNDNREEIVKDFFEKEIWKGEGIQYHKNGTKINILSSSKIIKDIKGKNTGIIAINRDITDYKEIKRNLERSEEKWRSYVESSPENIAVLDRDGKILFVNQPIVDTVEETIGTNLFDHLTPDMQESGKNYLNLVFETGGKYKFESYILDPTGNKIWLEIHVAPIKEGDKVISALYYYSEITERKKKDKDLREAFEIINSTPAIAFLWKNEEGWPVEFVSDNVKSTFGYIPEEFYSQDLVFANIIHPEDLERISNEVETYSSEVDRTHYTQEYRILTKDGKIKWIADKTSIRRNKEGSITHFQGIVLDISERKLVQEKLKESEENFRTITEDSHLAITILQDDRVVYTNQKMTDIFGYKKEEMLTWSPKEYTKTLAEDSREFVMEQARKKQIGDPNVKLHYPIHCIKSSGEKFWVDNISTTINYKGRPADLVTIIDTTERRNAEEKLKESEEKFRNIAEQNLMGICILQDNVIKYINKAMADMYGYTIEEILNWKPMEFLKLFTPDSLEIVREQALKKQRGDPDQLVQYMIHGVKKSGELIWVDNISRTINFKGRPADLITEIDISERIKTEHKMQESEEKYRMLFEGANDGIALIKDYKFIECNAKTLEIFRIKNDSDFIGHFTWEVAPASQPDGRDSKKASLVYMDEALKGKAQRFYWKLIRKDGTPIDTELSLNRIMINKEYYLQVIARDITERIKADLKIKKSEEKFREAYNLSNFYKDLFTHDMNNILQSIISTSEFYTLFKDDPEKMNNLGDIAQIVKNHARRGSKLVTNVRKLSRLDEMKISFKFINVSTILNKAIDHIKSGFQKRDIKVKIIGLSEDSIVLGNDLLIDVFDNLLNNAVKYTLENKEVNVDIKISKTIENDKSFLKFEFIDNGIGVPDDRKQLLFQRQTTEEINEKSMGMGLSLVKKIVDKYGGKIWVEDRIKGDYAKGSNFVLMLKES